MRNDLDNAFLTASAQALERAKAAGLPEIARAEAPGGSGAASILVVPGELHQMVAKAEAVLGRRGDTFQRGPLLVRVARLAETGGAMRRTAGALGIVPLDKATLRVRLTESATFEKQDGRSNGWRPIDCPKDVAEALLVAVGMWPSIPPLVGIVEAPTLRADGSVLATPGYDAGSGLYFDPGPTVWPAVPDAPTRDDALAALTVLRQPFSGFPFIDEAAESVALSAVLTALVRPSLRSAPLFVMTAPKMASGKTLLATLAAYIATGRPPPMLSQADDAESERKRLLALLLEGSPVAVIDNVERPIQSDALCSILTEPTFKDRVLGESRTVSVPTTTTWIATGNNVVVAGDLTSRTLVCRLDPLCERPEERRFEVNLHEDVPHRRGELVAAALTIVRRPSAGLRAGSSVAASRWSGWAWPIRARPARPRKDATQCASNLGP
jgi:hypothetical protein